jgi:hypothetical protein
MQYDSLGTKRLGQMLFDPPTSSSPSSSSLPSSGVVGRLELLRYGGALGSPAAGLIGIGCVIKIQIFTFVDLHMDRCGSPGAGHWKECPEKPLPTSGRRRMSCRMRKATTNRSGPVAVHTSRPADRSSNACPQLFVQLRHPHHIVPFDDQGQNKQTSKSKRISSTKYYEEERI